jgi:hypothetical protein
MDIRLKIWNINLALPEMFNFLKRKVLKKKKSNQNQLLLRKVYLLRNSDHTHALMM